MWFVVMLFAALAASVAYFALKIERKKYKLGFLSLMLWGVTLMVFIDHAISYLGSGQFMEAENGGLAGSSLVLGVLMIVPVLAIWAIAAFTSLGEKIYPG